MKIEKKKKKFNAKYQIIPRQEIFLYRLGQLKRIMGWLLVGCRRIFVSSQGAVERSMGRGLAVDSRLVMGSLSEEVCLEWKGRFWDSWLGGVGMFYYFWGKLFYINHNTCFSWLIEIIFDLTNIFSCFKHLKFKKKKKFEKCFKLKQNEPYLFMFYLLFHEEHQEKTSLRYFIATGEEEFSDLFFPIHFKNVSSSFFPLFECVYFYIFF